MSMPSVPNGEAAAASSRNVFSVRSCVTPADREKRHGHAGRAVWFTGLSGAGKSTLATELERRLFEAGRLVYLLDGDNLRRGLCGDLGFSAADRTENIRRAAAVAKLFTDAGFICLCAFISPLRADRDLARGLFPPGRFVEVFVDAPIAICRQRDPKGLYRRADRGEIPDFTGVGSAYEIPLRPDLTVRTNEGSASAGVAQIFDYLSATEPLAQGVRR